MGIFHRRVMNLKYEELMWRTVYPDYESRGGVKGIHINERNATTVTDFFKCVHVIAEDIAKLPKKVKRMVDVAGRPTRIDAPTHPLYWLVHAEPNPLMTSFRFFETGVIHMLSWGSWYNYIQRGPNSGRVQALWPLAPHLVRIEARRPSDPPDVRYWYVVINAETNREERFYPDEILHIPWFSYDGITGQSPVRLLMDSFGVAKVQERYSARFFGNSARIGGLISPKDGMVLTETQVDELRESLKKHEGVDNVGRWAVVRGAVNWQQISMPNDQAQFLEARQYSRTDMAGICRLTPDRIGDFSRATFSNVEQGAITHATDALQPTVERIEQEFERALLAEYDKGKIFVHIELDGLKRGDTQARTEYYKAMFNMSCMSANDINIMENVPPFEGGDEHWIQLNMVPVSMAKELLTQKAQPTKPNQTNLPSQQPQNPTNALQFDIMDESTESRVMAELEARVRRSYEAVMRDAVGRTLHRKPSERERFAPSAFKPIFESLALMLAQDLPKEIGDDYLRELAKRSVRWDENQSTQIVNDELDRMVESLTVALAMP